MKPYYQYSKLYRVNSFLPGGLGDVALLFSSSSLSTIRSDIKNVIVFTAYHLESMQYFQGVFKPFVTFMVRQQLYEL